jgi:hypothetical protein
MFDFLNNEQAAMEQAEKKEKDFVRERDSFNQASHDDAAYLETQERKSDLLRWQQEFGDELDGLYHELLSEEKKGKEWDPNLKTYVEKDVPPLCNSNFAEKVIRISVKPWLNKNAVNSNLDEKTIIKMLRNTHNDVVGAISDGWGMHGIQSIDDANTIARMLKNYTDPAAFRAWNGWTKKMDSSMIKRIESQQEMSGEKPQNKGLLGLFGNA